eukprot:scaffold7588_cov154-Chaetoceros_neogracile.AAC.1
MNPDANTWKPSVSAATWTPGAPAPAPAPTPAAPTKQESNVSDIDESDPLWQLVLKIANGDREKATRMINDPDSLTQYPEVVEFLTTAGSSEDMDMETDNVTDDVTEQLAKEVEAK